MLCTTFFEYQQNKDLYIQKIIIVENYCISNNIFVKLYIFKIDCRLYFGLSNIGSIISSFFIFQNLLYDSLKIIFYFVNNLF